MRARVLKKGPRIRARERIQRLLKLVFGDSQVFEEVPSVLTKSGAGGAYFTHFYYVVCRPRKCDKSTMLGPPVKSILRKHRYL